MSSIPSNISRVTTLMSSRLFLTNLTRTNLSMLGLQTRMATGRSVNRPSDDPVRASAIEVLNGRLEQGQQRLRNLSAAETSLNLLDAAVGEASDLVLQAKSIAASQIGATSDAETRRQEAVVIDSLIRQLYDLTNREHNGLYLFGGSTATRRPVSELAGGFRYTGRGSGLLTDLGAAGDIPVTLGAGSALGEVSARLRSAVDLNPGLTPQTRLSDLRGARGLGVAPSVVEFSFDGGPVGAVDLSGADTVQDVVDALTSAIRAYEAEHNVAALGPAGVYLAGGSIGFDLPVGGGELTFADVGSGSGARDLGLTGPLTGMSPLSADLDPKVTGLTELSSIGSLTLPLGEVQMRLSTATGSTVRRVDLSSARTIGDVINLIESGAPGVRARVNDAGTGIDVMNEVAGPTLSIEEVPGNNQTAGQLGIRSYSPQTRIADFNGGRGVRIVEGATDPQTGLPDPARDVDFTVTLGDGSSFTVDLRAQDLATVQTVIDRINEEAAAAVAAGTIPAGAFQAGLSADANGIAFYDLQGLGPIAVAKANNSPAAGDLGLLDGAYDAGSATFTAQDRAGIRVESVFTALIDLRDALLANDSAGITLAGEALEVHVDRIASTRALVGVHANRVVRAVERQEDQSLLDEKIRSELRDLDYTEAAIRLSMLQTQLQAGMMATAQSQSRSLLDFLG